VRRDAQQVARQIALQGDAVMLPYGRTLDVVVDPEREPELARLVGKRREAAVEVPVVAVLRRDLKSLDERYATQVLVNLYPVGRLSREDAVAYGPILDELLESDGLHGACEGRIIADWPMQSPLRPGTGAALRGNYRVKLWLALPAQLEVFLDRGTYRTSAFDPKKVRLPEIPLPPRERFESWRRRRGCLLPLLAVALPTAATLLLA
jgi:hypothetical protein